MPVRVTVKAPETQLCQQGFSTVTRTNSDEALREENLQLRCCIMSCNAIFVTGGKDRTPPYP